MESPKSSGNINTVLQAIRETSGYMELVIRSREILFESNNSNDILKNIMLIMQDTLKEEPKMLMKKEKCYSHSSS